MHRVIVVSLIARLGLFPLLVVPAEAAPKDLDTYDAVPLLQGDIHNADDRRAMWDTQMLLSALQGLVNRDAPQLYAFQVISKEVDLDHYWLDKLQEPGGWLESTQIHPQKDLLTLVSKYRALLRGVVVWDERVPATANVAATAAGADDLLPVRYDPDPNSLFHALVKDPNGPRLPVIFRLMNADGSPMFTGSVSGSAKCDAYLWAVDNYLKTGKCSTDTMAYYPDAWWLETPLVSAVKTVLCNHDYFIANRAFFFDLSPWEDEAPNDDPTQPTGTDNKTMLTVLGAAYTNANGGIIHVGGFTPWDQKYTEHRGGIHGGVTTEWRFTEILSCFNAYIDADAPGLQAMANASVFQHFPLAASYPQTNLPTIQDLKDKGYIDASGNVAPRNFVTFYVGDYDSAAWLYQKMPTLWDDPNRGQVPMGWAFDPALAKRFPVGMAYARATATANDTFQSGDSGYGYLNPGLLEGSRPWSGGLPSGLKAWEKLCAEGYRQWDLRITGFVLDGNAPEMNAATKAAYARFSPGGVVAAKLTPDPPMLVNGVPFMKKGPDIDKRLTMNQKTARIYKALPHSEPKQPNFAHFRIILWSPTQLKELRDTLRAERPDIEVVEPHTLFALLRRSLNNK